MARFETRDSLAGLKREILIAGGGLAGLSLASALRLRNVPVTVLEAGSYPRHRVCGEFISGVSDATLEKLGISSAFKGALRHRSLAWFDHGRLVHRDELDAPALGISRHLLDDRLRRRVEELGGEIRTDHRARPEPRESLVWTAGRKARNGPWIGLKGHVKLPAMTADLEMHGGSNGYLGFAGVEDGWTNACGLFRLDRSIHGSGTRLLTNYLRTGGNAALADRLEGAIWREKSFCAVAGFELGRQPSVPGLLALGDAESMIPPFTGNGMSMAFESAEIATGPLAAWSEGNLSWQHAGNLIRKSVHRRFRRRLAIARIFHSVLLSPAGRSLFQDLSASRLLPFKPMLSLIR